jgi:hypothetical protein
MPVTRIVEVPQPIPPSLLDCAPEPPRPPGELPGNALSDIQVGILFAETVAAGRDCRAKLARLRDLVKPAP